VHWGSSRRCWKGGAFESPECRRPQTQSRAGFQTLASESRLALRYGAVLLVSIPRRRTPAPPSGSEARAAGRPRWQDLTRGFVLEYRRSRTRATSGREGREVKGESMSGATMNRGLAALGAFLTWVREIEGLPIERPPLPRERESRGRERWLSDDELHRFTVACAPEWWQFFAVLFLPGARLERRRGCVGATFCSTRSAC
jgi:integrase